MNIRQDKNRVAADIKASDALIKWHAISSSFLLENDSRFDAATYSIEKYEAIRQVEACKLIKSPLGSLCGTIWHPVQNQARSNFRRVYTHRDHGDPYVGSREMFFFPLRPDKFLSRAFPKLQELRVPENWLLLSRSGTVGNIIYCSKKLSQCLVTDHAIRIEPTKVPSGYLYAFLSCKFGKTQLLNSTYGSTVSELEPQHIASLLVPMADSDIQIHINDLIVEAYRLRDQANELLEKADMAFHKALGLDPFDESDIEYIGKKNDPRAFVINAGELGSRFDATNHVPITRSAVHKLTKSHVALSKMGDTDISIFIPARFKRNYVEFDQGVTYLIPSQVCLIRPYGLKYISSAQATSLPEYLLRKGELLVSTDGTIGRLHMVTEYMDGWFGSNNLARLRSDTLDLGYLYTFLSTPYGQHQICREIYGGVVDHISEKQLADVIIPIPAVEVQNFIGHFVFEAFTMKDRANQLEDQAITFIEEVIETSGGDGR